MDSKKKRKLPCSGNELVDWHFRRLIYILENKVDKIFVTHGPLRHPDKKRKRLTGFAYLFDVDCGKIHRSIIFVSGDKKQLPDKTVAAMTLTHELLHVLLPVPEKDILRLENILWKYFTQEQKNLIKSYFA